MVPALEKAVLLKVHPASRSKQRDILQRIMEWCVQLFQGYKGADIFQIVCTLPYHSDVFISLHPTT